MRIQVKFPWLFMFSCSPIPLLNHSGDMTEYFVESKKHGFLISLNDTSDHVEESKKGIKGIVERKFAYLFLVYFVIALIIYPFYVHVYRTNMERDRNIAIFQILRHFYNFLKCYYISLVLFFIAFFIVLNSPNTIIYYLFGIPFAACYAISSLFVEANQYLLSLLAIQKFFIYFFPDTEKILSFSQNTMGWILTGIYGFCIFINCCFFWAASKNFDVMPLKEIYYVMQSLMVILSAVLYIPIMMSIRKFAYLASAKSNRPQRYVFFNCQVADVMFIPLVIQLSHIGCNRRNMNILWSSLKSGRSLRLIFCFCFPPAMRSNKVEVGVYTIWIEQNVVTN
ncbi:hypothetical protein CAEBREN_14577 [Caenorhabditis brenneri]|uniref:Serpentine Receptor, class Z n=1 Tax=Caenorhabditis brenneri TaxID=135651 RepID=G0N1E0_CAEBE|nr:hypothetical protein CAEBREN_14577 [Caenorhabditis brenneri]